MYTSQKILIGAAAAAVVIGGVAIGVTLSRTPDKIDVSTIHTQPSAETMPASTEAPSSSAQEPSRENTASSVSASLETYTSGKVSIQYPVVSHLSDSQLEERVNALLKANALSVIKANGINEETDGLEIECSVISVDRSRLTATYTGVLTAQGAAQPVNLFYSNTVSLTQAQDLGLEDFADAYTMAGYVLSDDVQFLGLTEEEVSAVKEYRSSLSLDELTEIFQEADFPLESESAWPQSFSYEKQGLICFSMPVPHALGDYVIVSFEPSTK